MEASSAEHSRFTPPCSPRRERSMIFFAQLAMGVVATLSVATFIGRLLKRAAEGDNRSITIVLNQVRLLKEVEEGRADMATPERDREVLEEFARMMGGSLDDLLSDAEERPDA